MFTYFYGKSATYISYAGRTHSGILAAPVFGYRPFSRVKHKDTGQGHDY